MSESKSPTADKAEQAAAFGRDAQYVLRRWVDAEGRRCTLYYCQAGDEEQAELITRALNLQADNAAVWQFAAECARPSGDGPTCECVPCRAFRAVNPDYRYPVKATSGEKPA